MIEGRLVKWPSIFPAYYTQGKTDSRPLGVKLFRNFGEFVTRFEEYIFLKRSGEIFHVVPFVCFQHSGYDRGHLAPAANHSTMQAIMNNTFLLSNMCAQVSERSHLLMHRDRRIFGHSPFFCLPLINKDSVNSCFHLKLI